jgi:hypothetical protein
LIFIFIYVLIKLLVIEDLLYPFTFTLKWTSKTFFINLLRALISTSFKSKQRFVAFRIEGTQLFYLIHLYRQWPFFSHLFYLKKLLRRILSGIYNKITISFHSHIWADTHLFLLVFVLLLNCTIFNCFKKGHRLVTIIVAVHWLLWIRTEAFFQRHLAVSRKLKNLCECYWANTRLLPL